MRDAMHQAWGNPSSSHPAGRDPGELPCRLPAVAGPGPVAVEARGGAAGSHPAGGKAKELIGSARESLARMVGGRPEDIVFTSGGTEVGAATISARGGDLPSQAHLPATSSQGSGDEEDGDEGCHVPSGSSFAPLPFSLQANNMVIHTACRHFRESQARPGDSWGTPHIVTSSVEHDSIRLPLEQLVKESLAGERQRDHRGRVGDVWLQTGVCEGGFSLLAFLRRRTGTRLLLDVPLSPPKEH